MFGLLLKFYNPSKMALDTTTMQCARMGFYNRNNSLNLTIEYYSLVLKLE